ncbi:hypothetical protein RCL1_006269 [Eukaryota sp. TZLM3-RCL]
MWTSVTQKPFIGVTAHWLTEHFEMQNVILAIECLPHPHTGEDIANYLLDLFEYFQVNEKIMGITSDNGTNVVKALDIVRDHLQVKVGRTIALRRCCAHVLNLAERRVDKYTKNQVFEQLPEDVQSTLSTYFSMITKVRQFVKRLHKSSSLAQEFRACLPQRCSNATIPLDVATRWNSTFLMLSSYQMFVTTLETLFESSVHENIESLKLNDSEKAILKTTVDFFAPFYEVTTLLSANKYVTQGLSVTYMNELHTIVQNTIASHNENSFLYYLSTEIAEILSKYKHCLEDHTCFIASVLDPRNKNKLIPQSLQTTVNAEHLKQEWRTYSNAVHATGSMTQNATVSPTSNLEIPSVRTSTHAMLREIEFKRRRLDESELTEVELYLNERLKPLDSNPLIYWNANKQELPGMAALARDYLSIQATSVAVEQLFSAAGRTATEERAAMSEETVTILVFVKSLLKHGFKLE